MGYSLSFDASIKVKSGDVHGLLNHNARDVDLENGIEVNHANQDIDRSKTVSNETLYYDHASGDFEECTDTEQIIDSLNTRLKSVKKPLRKDAVVARPLLLQLDPQYYKDNPDKDVDNSINDMLQWAVDTFGRANIVSASMHLDEMNPHLHLLFTPVTEDGRLAQKDWFENPTALKRMHQDFRQYMSDKGYDIDMSNRKPGKYAKRMSVEEYKRFASMKEERRALDAREKAIKGKEHDLASREAKISERKSRFEARIANFNVWWGEITKQAEKPRIEANKAIERANKVVDRLHDLAEDMSEPYIKAGKSVPKGIKNIIAVEENSRKTVNDADKLANHPIPKPQGFEDWEAEQERRKKRLSGVQFDDNQNGAEYSLQV